MHHLVYHFLSYSLLLQTAFIPLFYRISQEILLVY